MLSIWWRIPDSLIPGGCGQACVNQLRSHDPSNFI